MINDTLPYFIQLIKNNILIHALVVSGSWHNVDLKKYDHDIIGQTLVINGFMLTKDDSFEINFNMKDAISGAKGDKVICLSIFTRDSKYFDNTAFYFGDDENKGRNKNLLIKSTRGYKRDFGIFRIYDDAISPAFVTMTRNPAYGYMIYFRFYTNFDAVYKIKKEVDDALEASADSAHLE